LVDLLSPLWWSKPNLLVGDGPPDEDAKADIDYLCRLIQNDKTATATQTRSRDCKICHTDSVTKEREGYGCLPPDVCSECCVRAGKQWLEAVPTKERKSDQFIYTHPDEYGGDESDEWGADCLPDCDFEEECWYAKHPSKLRKFDGKLYLVKNPENHNRDVTPSAYCKKCLPEVELFGTCTGCTGYMKTPTLLLSPKKGLCSECATSALVGSAVGSAPHAPLYKL